MNRIGLGGVLLVLCAIAGPVVARQQLLGEGTLTQDRETRTLQMLVDRASVGAEDGITKFHYDQIVRDTNGSVWSHRAVRVGVDCARPETVMLYQRENYISGGEAIEYRQERWNNPEIARVLPDSGMATVVATACEQVLAVD